MMARSFLLFAAVCSGGLIAAANAQQTTDVDLQLVLAADISGSMSQSERRLQRDGYVAAFRNRDVAAAVFSGSLGRIAVTFVEWAGQHEQIVIVPWTMLADEQDLADFARRLATAPMGRRGARTALSSCLLFAAHQFSLSGLRSHRRTIDVSGDGASDDGPPIAWARNVVLGMSITINGLSTVQPNDGSEGPFGDLFGPSYVDVHAYYRDEVIGGPGAFALAVNDMGDFPAAIRRKLVLEIAGDKPGSMLIDERIWFAPVQILDAV